MKGGTKINSIANFEAVKVTDDLKELAKQPDLKTFAEFIKRKKMFQSNLFFVSELEEDDDTNVHGTPGPKAKRDRTPTKAPTKRKYPAKAPTVKATSKAPTVKATSKATDVSGADGEETTKWMRLDPEVDECVNVNQARRLVKKVIARNK